MPVYSRILLGLLATILFLGLSSCGRSRDGKSAHYVTSKHPYYYHEYHRYDTHHVGDYDHFNYYDLYGQPQHERYYGEGDDDDQGLRGPRLNISF